MRYLVTLMVIAAASPVHADVSAAARAFTDGQAAQLDGDYERASQSFELAFSIAPSKEALRSAVRAHVQALHVARAATLAALLLERYGSDPASAQLAKEVLADAAPKLGRVALTCASPCSLAIDGRAASVDAASARHVVYVTPGHLALAVTFEGSAPVQRQGDVVAGGELVLEVARPAPTTTTPAPVPAATPKPAAAPARASHGLPPAVTIAGGIATLALGGAALWSGLDTLDAHDKYKAMPTPAGWDDGRSKQLRTNILIGSTAVVGVATIAVAVFWTQWRGERAQLAVTPGIDGRSVAIGGHF